MTVKLLVVVVVFFTNVRLCQSKKYENYTLFNAVPSEASHLSFLQKIDKEKYIDVVFWKHPHKMYESVQFIVNPNDLDIFHDKLKENNLTVTILMEDVQKGFDSQPVKRYLRLQPDKYSFDEYHTVEDINQWLADIVKKYPDIVNLESIGKSAEDRDINVVTIKRVPGSAAKVMVEGGIHGHEWISVAFVTYLADQLIRANESSDSNLRYIADKYHWYLIPLVNPDGYDYTHRVDRLWRKNRKLYNDSVGVNLNRNFDQSFGKHDTSIDPKHSSYCGPKPFSESETQALANFIRSHKLKYYFSFHGYGQKVILPYADRVKHVENYYEMENYARQAILEMQGLKGTKYGVGTMYDTLGTRISGDSASWVKKTFKVKYVFTFLLRDNGTFGYALPSDQLRSTCDETVVGLSKLMTAHTSYVNTNLFDQASWIRDEALIVALCFLFCICLQ